MAIVGGWFFLLLGLILIFASLSGGGTLQIGGLLLIVGIAAIFYGKHLEKNKKTTISEEAIQTKNAQRADKIFKTTGALIIILFATLAVLIVPLYVYDQVLEKEIAFDKDNGMYSAADRDAELKLIKNSQWISDIVSYIPIPKKLYSETSSRDEIIEKFAESEYTERHSGASVPDDIKASYLKCVLSVKGNANDPEEEKTFVDVYNRAQSSLLGWSLSTVERLVLTENMLKISDKSDACDTEITNQVQGAAAIASGKEVLDGSGKYWSVRRGWRAPDGSWQAFGFGMVLGEGNGDVALQQDCTAHVNGGEYGDFPWIKRKNGDVVVLSTKGIVFKNAPTPPGSEKCDETLRQQEQPKATESNSAVVNPDGNTPPTANAARASSDLQPASKDGPSVGMNETAAPRTPSITSAASTDAPRGAGQEARPIHPATDNSNASSGAESVVAPESGTEPDLSSNASAANWQFSRGQYSVTMTSADGTIVHLWKNCDAQSPQEGAGHWSWNEDGWSIELDGKQFAKFANVTPPYPDDTACEAQ